MQRDANIGLPGGRPLISTDAGVTVRRLGIHLGAEVSGIDLRQPLAAAQFEAIQRSLAENELLVFRDQMISADDLIAFGRRFGELTVHPFAPHERESPVLIRFRNDEARPPFGTDVWHSDETFRKGRQQVLVSLLEGPGVFRTEYARREWEATARDNLRAEFAALAE